MCDNRAPAALYHCYTLLHLSLAPPDSFARPPAHPGQGRRPARQEIQSYAEKTTSKATLLNLTEDQQICLKTLHIRTLSSSPHQKGGTEKGRCSGPPTTCRTYQHRYGPPTNTTARGAPWEQSKHNRLFPSPATARAAQHQLPGCFLQTSSCEMSLTFNPHLPKEGDRP